MTEILLLLLVVFIISYILTVSKIIDNSNPDDTGPGI
jgi:hypothetical protein